VKLWTGFITPKVLESRDFYTRILECGLVYEGEGEDGDPWFVLLRLGSTELGFMKPDLEFQAPIFRSAFHGEGAWIAVDVQDVDAEHARLRGLGIDIAVSLRDEPWGDRHFAILDPNGIGIDFVQRADSPETTP
jgi:catechol 2,3-dioxygenase-like lactoylglutathione lyase family enzyme